MSVIAVHSITQVECFLTDELLYVAISTVIPQMIQNTSQEVDYRLESVVNGGNLFVEPF